MSCLDNCHAECPSSSEWHDTDGGARVAAASHLMRCLAKSWQTALRQISAAALSQRDASFSPSKQFEAAAMLRQMQQQGEKTHGQRRGKKYSQGDCQAMGRKYMQPGRNGWVGTRGEVEGGATEMVTWVACTGSPQH